MIRNYKDGDLGSGFIGVRVAVSIGGKVKQKWFANSRYEINEALELAGKLESTWFEMQIEHEQNDIISNISNTGIKGLSFTYDQTVKTNGKIYAYPIISFQRRKKELLLSEKWFIPNNLCMTDETWLEICSHIKKVRKLKQKTFLKLISIKPDSKKYFSENKMKIKKVDG